ncbi:Carbon storage regulator [Vibrio crassostreae]|nr:hypothetical protein EDB37_1010122 [Vibrio crassostreae]TVU67103.1 hypothetical protein FQP87_25190 [Vibrio tasmaniensis]CAK2398954.1 Carbon storage regulator [Vibrio crassostreae]CAK3908917.1 Carbon storage regulator [Vibrio crassostreae]
MKIRSTVSSDISRHVIWVNSIDFLILKAPGGGVSIRVCDCATTIKQMREEDAYAKKTEKTTETTSEHRASAKGLLSCLYND